MRKFSAIFCILWMYTTVAKGQVGIGHFATGNVKFETQKGPQTDNLPFSNIEENKLLWSVSDSSYYVYNGNAWVKILDTKLQHLDTVFSMEYDICTWNKKTDRFSDYARDGNMACQLGKYFYSFGGWNSHINPCTDNHVYRSTDDLSTWDKLPDAPWRHRHCFGLTVKNDTIFVYGGDLSDKNFDRDAWAATADKNGNLQWHLLTDKLPWGERILFGSCMHNGAMYVIGGQKGVDYNKDGTCADVWRSYDGKNWEKIADGLTQFGKNLSGSVASYNGYIYVIAGGKYHNVKANNTYSSEVWRSKNGIDWERLPNAPFIGRQFTNTVVYDNKLFLFFGGNNNYQPANNKGIWYMDNNQKWYKVHNPGIPPRHACGLNTYKDSLGKEYIAIVGGNEWNDVWLGHITNNHTVAQYVSPVGIKKNTNKSPDESLLDKFHPLKHPYRAMVVSILILGVMFACIVFLVNSYFIRKQSRTRTLQSH